VGSLHDHDRASALGELSRFRQEFYTSLAARADALFEYGAALPNIRPTTALPASAPKPSRPGPGRPPGSRNQRPAISHDVGKTVKCDRTITARQQRAG
jgi:hypothetical protein